jgi:hypothetical protein
LQAQTEAEQKGDVVSQPVPSPSESGWRFVILSALALGLAIGMGTTKLEAASAARRASSTPVCRTSRLVIWLDTRANGTAGSVYYHLHFTNLSGHACTLRGYPGVSAVAFAGQRLGSAAARMTTHVRTLKLARGDTADVLLRVVEAGNYPAARCHPTTAAGLRVYPPGDIVSKVVPFPLRACGHTGPVFLRVGAAVRS